MEDRSKTLYKKFARDALATFTKNTMQNVVPIEGCAKFAVEYTPQHCII